MQHDMTETGAASETAAFIDAANRSLAAGDFSDLSIDEIRRVMTAAVRAYAAKAEIEEVREAPVDADQVTATDVVVVVSELLRAVDLNLFDLAMWYRRS